MGITSPFQLSNLKMELRYLANTASTSTSWDVFTSPTNNYSIVWTSVSLAILMVYYRFWLIFSDKFRLSGIIITTSHLSHYIFALLKEKQLRKFREKKRKKVPRSKALNSSAIIRLHCLLRFKGTVFFHKFMFVKDIFRNLMVLYYIGFYAMSMNFMKLPSTHKLLIFFYILVCNWLTNSWILIESYILWMNRDWLQFYTLLCHWIANIPFMACTFWMYGRDLLGTVLSLMPSFLCIGIKATRSLFKRS